MSYGIGICSECFNEFEKNTPTQETCGTECRRVRDAKRPNLTAERKRLKRLARRRKYGI